MMNKKPEMTRKEALAVVQKVVKAVGWHLYEDHATEEEKILREQVYKALQLLTSLVHGKPCHDDMSSLCDVCFLRYVEIRSPFAIFKGETTRHSLCKACIQLLRAEGKIARLEDWETGEVTPC